MHQIYSDILSRIGSQPLWFDEHGVPRFAPFTPGQVANIYAKEAVLLRIECQACGQSFKVAFTGPAASRPLAKNDHNHRIYPLLRDYIREGRLHYGDPPNMACCDAGPSMNSVPRNVLEYWVKPYVLGEGAGCRWPRVRLADGAPAAPVPVILATEMMTFRRDPKLEGIDLSPGWVR